MGEAKNLAQGQAWEDGSRGASLPRPLAPGRCAGRGLAFGGQAEVRGVALFPSVYQCCHGTGVAGEMRPGVRSSSGKVGANNFPVRTARHLVEGQPDTVPSRGEHAPSAPWHTVGRLSGTSCCWAVRDTHLLGTGARASLVGTVAAGLSASTALEVVTGKHLYRSPLLRRALG